MTYPPETAVSASSTQFTKRGFKGVWIPKSIWLNPDLSLREKCLLVEIDSLDNDSERGCFASNEYLGNFLGISTGHVTNMITRLKGLGFITQVYFDGRQRGLRVTCLHENMDADSMKTWRQTPEKHGGSLPENMEPIKDISLSLGNKFSEEQQLQIFSEFFPTYTPSVFQQDQIATLVTDLGVWRTAVTYWASNNYQPRSIGKLLELYDRLVSEATKPQATRAVVDDFKDACPICSNGFQAKCPIHGGGA